MADTLTDTIQLALIAATTDGSPPMPGIITTPPTPPAPTAPAPAPAAPPAPACLTDHPLYYIPGYTGSVLEWTQHPSGGCTGNCRWRRLWLNIGDFLFHRKRLMHALGVTETTQNGLPCCNTTMYPDAQVRAPPVGSWEGTRRVDDLKSDHIFRYHDVRPLEKSLIEAGWRSNETLFSIPNDFRCQPCIFWQTCDDGKTEVEHWASHIEEQVAKTGQKALLVAHSQGSYVATAILQKMGEDWSQRNILGLYLCAPALAGCGQVAQLSVGVGISVTAIPYTSTANMASWPAHHQMTLTPRLAPLEPLIVHAGRVFYTEDLAELGPILHNGDTACVQRLRAVKEAMWSFYGSKEGEDDGLKAGFVPPPTVPTHVMMLRGKPTAQVYDIRSAQSARKISRQHRRQAQHAHRKTDLVPTMVYNVDGDTVLPFRPLRALIDEWRICLGSKAQPANEKESLEPPPEPAVQATEPGPAGEKAEWLDLVLKAADARAAKLAEDRHADAVREHKAISEHMGEQKVLLTTSLYNEYEHEQLMWHGDLCKTVLLPEIIEFIKRCRQY